MDVRVRDHVVVVEHEHDSRLESGRVVEKEREHDVDGPGARGAVCRQRAPPDVRLHDAQRLDQVGQEARWIVVGVVEREPGDRSTFLGAGPLREQSRLPEARRRGQQRQPAGCAFPQELEELAADNVLRADGRPDELRLEDDGTRHARAAKSVPLRRLRWHLGRTLARSVPGKDRPG
jgi:hypothetical protein